MAKSDCFPLEHIKKNVLLFKDYYKHFPPSLARFSPVDSDIIVYTGYGMKKQLLYYSLSRKKVLSCLSFCRNYYILKH